MPLRPELFKRLKAQYKHVAIANEGEEMVAHTTINKYTGRKQLVITLWGESYRVSCRFCTDTRQRLWISHIWGTRHPETGSLNLALATCYNEDCMVVEGRRKILYDEVFNSFDANIEDFIEKSNPVGSKPFTWPGEMRLMSQLVDDHRVKCYLRKRSFDPDELSKTFEIGFCVAAAPEFDLAQSRLVIPVRFKGELVGWQARDLTGLSDIKYYSMPGWKRSLCLYNYDVAKNYPYVVVTEGPTKVWRYGPEAVCTFGKNIAAPQFQLLAAWPTIVLMLDGDVLPEEIEKNIEGIRRHASDKRIIPIRLSPGQDPGDMDRQYLRSLVQSELSKPCNSQSLLIPCQ